MENWVLAILLKPLILFAFLCFVASFAVAVRKWMPEGRLKRFLLQEI